METTKYVYRVEMEWTEKDGVHRDNTWGIAENTIDASENALKAFGPIVRRYPGFVQEDGYRITTVEEMGKAIFR